MVDWEVDWGVMDAMLSLIALEVTGISQNFQKVVKNIKLNSVTTLLNLHHPWQVHLQMYPISQAPDSI